MATRPPCRLSTFCIPALLEGAGAEEDCAAVADAAALVAAADEDEDEALDEEELVDFESEVAVELDLLLSVVAVVAAALPLGVIDSTVFELSTTNWPV